MGSGARTSRLACRSGAPTRPPLPRACVRVDRALLALPVEYRQVIVLRHFGGLNYDDIAATLGIPSKTVKSRLYSARQRLADLLTAGKAQ